MFCFDKSYEVCNCKKITIENLEDAIKNQNALSLGEIQNLTTAGTECRHCLFEEADFGKMKKRIYCKDILNQIKKELNYG
ncbi:MAG: (2Fe-2S)-binding protein [Aliarcobacter sp.]|nr:(2Fe-2S)-binding protein [Aliarcobacter sp.]